MKTEPKTIFTSPTLHPAKKIETKKPRYWLGTIFNQEKDRAKTPDNPVNQRVEQTIIKKTLAKVINIKSGNAEKNRQAIEDIISGSNRVLLEVSSVFPWDLFPSKIIVEDTRLVIAHRQLLFSQVHSVDIKDISNIFIDTSILFAELVIVSNTFAQNQIIINRLWKKDAILVRNCIEGLRKFIKNDIDTTSLKAEELVGKLKELNEKGIII